MSAMWITHYIFTFFAQLFRWLINKCSDTEDHWKADKIIFGTFSYLFCACRCIESSAYIKDCGTCGNKTKSEEALRIHHTKICLHISHNQNYQKRLLANTHWCTLQHQIKCNHGGKTFDNIWIWQDCEKDLGMVTSCDSFNLSSYFTNSTIMLICLAACQN